MEIIDYLIVGSGCTGAMAAETLCAAGKKAVMLDVGLQGETGERLDTDFIWKRYQDETQHQFFLGPHYEALKKPTHPNILQQTAQRTFMTDGTNQFIPLKSGNFFPVESLALGGLGNGWGLGSYTFSQNELTTAGLPVAGMKAAYKVVAQRIGISGDAHDPASPYCHGNDIPLQASIAMNPSAGSLFNRYLKNKDSFQQKNLYMGRPSLALLTQPQDGRSLYTYKDLDFYANEGNSAYRPYITIQKLIKKGELEYKSGWLAIRFTEEKEYSILECRNIHSNETQLFYTRKLILATGTLGTTRIVLRSFQTEDRLPVLCNAYTYMPMAYLPYLGKKNNGQFSGYAQLALFYDKYQDHRYVAMASIYNYRSLLYFRILKQMPLNYNDGINFLRLLIPGLVIAGIFHPAAYQKQNYVRLKKNAAATGDFLETNYTYEGEEADHIKEAETIYAKAFQRLGCIKLKTLRTIAGASIHYAGTLPFSERETQLGISPEGKLYGANNVFVADGSGFKFLPGKGLTLSLMANAHLVCENLLRHE